MAATIRINPKRAWERSASNQIDNSPGRTLQHPRYLFCGHIFHSASFLYFLYCTRHPLKCNPLKAVSHGVLRIAQHTHFVHPQNLLPLCRTFRGQPARKRCASARTAGSAPTRSPPATPRPPNLPLSGTPPNKEAIEDGGRGRSTSAENHRKGGLRRKDPGRSSRKKHERGLVRGH